MNSEQAEALRWISPLLLRLMTVDFLETDDLVDLLDDERED